MKLKAQASGKRKKRKDVPQAVLFIDMLGTRARWQTGGSQAARSAFDCFREIVSGKLQESNSAKVVAGGIESDSAAFLCGSSDYPGLCPEVVRHRDKGMVHRQHFSGCGHPRESQRSVVLLQTKTALPEGSAVSSLKQVLARCRYR